MTDQGPRTTHPEYLDDDGPAGAEGVQFVRYDLAADEDGVFAYLKREGLWWVDGDIDAVWMKPAGEGPRGAPEEWYDIVATEAEGVVRYWRVRP